MSKRKSPETPRNRPRNPLAVHPLMKKGGAHEKTRKAERRAAKVALRRGHPDLRPLPRAA